MKVINHDVFETLTDEVTNALQQFRLPVEYNAESWKPGVVIPYIEFDYKTVNGTIQLHLLLDSSFNGEKREEILQVLVELLQTEYTVKKTIVSKAKNDYQDYLADYRIVHNADVKMFWNLRVHLSDAITQVQKNKEIKPQSAFVKFSTIKPKIKLIQDKHNCKIKIQHAITGSKVTWSYNPDALEVLVLLAFRKDELVDENDELIPCLHDKYYALRLKPLSEIRPIITAMQKKHGFTNPDFTNVYNSGNTMLKYYNKANTKSLPMLEEMQKELSAIGVKCTVDGITIFIEGYTSTEQYIKHKTIVGY
jgi:hypothetical protein